MAFKTGTVVQLKSGGPEMTIKGVIGDGSLSQSDENSLKIGNGYRDGDVYCQWFSGNEIKSVCFKSNMLDECED